ncbi:hypothetical protein TNCV_365941 [Trichonephila clavipes]|nr:hypothetical protein TNCV_365941 [Trichonephila clavipes]
MATQWGEPDPIARFLISFFFRSVKPIPLAMRLMKQLGGFALCLGIVSGVYFAANLEIATEKKRQPARAFCDGIINLRKKLFVQKEKQRPAKRLGRSIGEGEAGFCSKSMEVFMCCHLWTFSALENGMENVTKKLAFKPYHSQ